MLGFAFPRVVPTSCQLVTQPPVSVELGSHLYCCATPFTRVNGIISEIVPLPASPTAASAATSAAATNQRRVSRRLDGRRTRARSSTLDVAFRIDILLNIRLARMVFPRRA